MDVDVDGSAAACAGPGTPVPGEPLLLAMVVAILSTLDVVIIQVHLEIWNVSSLRFSLAEYASDAASTAKRTSQKMSEAYDI